MSGPISSTPVAPPPGHVLDGDYLALAYERGDVEVYETQSEALVARLPNGTPDDAIGLVVLAYERGYDAGRQAGRAEKAHEIRRALML
ncbi:hypothetical protein OKC48_23745 [Methylorubrum extorquens]|uniref:hypothetical protein n=1 Tax=Methylorubrum extorquens TaxID=408 RepID=UPI002238005B|nr:hypothetical protein [Methylorubrum extorquens]UYW26246.1 hypothetical protein OKC48_23745 [Methylorubrum extorquens]